ncbi:hypothetical protein M427DRAFT_428728 [Gonapodya prolifera JEL478]|uniref:Uncharacterized protein n=1 Tax=Gonapodya prolifera (strain JEL478) TaxID=1344416 RepID=A0A139ASU6_GONPJ|nr:hypothetical protein M427DRAFT_428728 [Gonapodya prolifera JEL478]|eukprot:KXS19744.1 hypothetical protein M427DRAFT_428728 [Gonapodya prolifera JEL478]
MNEATPVTSASRQRMRLAALTKSHTETMGPLSPAELQGLLPRLSRVNGAIKEITTRESAGAEECLEPVRALAEEAWRIGSLPVAHFCVRMMHIIIQDSDIAGNAAVEAREFVRPRPNAPSPVCSTPLHASIQSLLFLIYDMISSIAFAVRFDSTHLYSSLMSSKLGTRWILIEALAKLAARDYDAPELVEHEKIGREMLALVLGSEEAVEQMLRNMDTEM